MATEPPPLPVGGHYQRRTIAIYSEAHPEPPREARLSMEFAQFLRLMLRRWPLLFVAVAAGVGIGYTTTLIGDDPAPDAPVVTHWSAAEILRSGTTENLDLVRIAPLAVLGPDAAAVAAERGADLDALGLRAVTDVAEATITVSAVALDPAEASVIASETAQAFLESLVAAEASAFDNALAAAELEAQGQLDIVDAAQTEIDFLNSRNAALDEGESLPPAQLDRLRRATAQRDAATAAAAQALATVDQLQRTGAPEPPMSLLRSVPPRRISEAEYQARLDQAEQGLNAFTTFDVPNERSDTAGSDRLSGPVPRSALGGIAGLLIGMMVIIVHARLDNRLHTTAAIEGAFGLPVIAEIPVMARRDRKTNVLHARSQPYSSMAEAHRYLRSVLLFASRSETGPATTSTPDTGPVAADQHRREVRVVMITSAGPGEGKTTTAANLAVLMAEAGYDTVLMNCDHRRPRAHELFGVPYAPATVTPTQHPLLHIITDVARHLGETPAELSERQRDVIARARSEADVVVLDTAPLLATNDALDLVSDTDLVVLVARQGRTTATSARKVASLLLDRMHAPVAGVVATATGSADRYYGGYKGYYGTPASSAAATTPAPARMTPAAPARMTAPAPVRPAEPVRSATTAPVGMTAPAPAPPATTAPAGIASAPALSADPSPGRVSPFDIVLDLCDPDNPRVRTNGHGTAAAAEADDRRR